LELPPLEYGVVEHIPEWIPIVGSGNVTAGVNILDLDVYGGINGVQSFTFTSYSVPIRLSTGDMCEVPINGVASIEKLIFQEVCMNVPIPQLLLHLLH
jgi:hypothetical protein